MRLATLIISTINLAVWLLVWRQSRHGRVCGK